MASGAATYLYNFSRPVDLPALLPVMLGATHGSEIAYVFGAGMPVTDDDAAAGRSIRGHWTAFAGTGSLVTVIDLRRGTPDVRGDLGAAR